MGDSPFACKAKHEKGEKVDCEYAEKLRENARIDCCHACWTHARVKKEAQNAPAWASSIKQRAMPAHSFRRIWPQVVRCAAQLCGAAAPLEPPERSCLCRYIRRQSAPIIGDQMKFNIDELTYEEIKEVVDHLRQMKIETKFARLGSSVILQTEQGQVQLPKNEAVAILGIPAIF